MFLKMETMETEATVVTRTVDVAHRICDCVVSGHPPDC